MHRTRSFLIVTAAYVTGIGVAIGVGWFSHQNGHHPLLTVLFADLACTGMVFLFTRFFKNTSIYDPYWSVVPVLIVLWYAVLGLEKGVEPIRLGVVTVVVALWGIRLTGNWVRRWKGLGHIDWRYVDFEQKTGRWFWWVSFAGLQLVPTLFVYLGCLPLYAALVEAVEPFGAWSWLAAGWTFGAVLLELAADNQLVTFLKRNPQAGAVCNTGLWAYSRFPNYFGEVAFWWGLYLLGWLANPAWWWTGAGALTITAMFHFISIPMMEKRHLERRPGYAQVMKRTPRWVPWFSQSQQDKHSL